MEPEQGEYEVGWGEPDSAAALSMFRACGSEKISDVVLSRPPITAVFKVILTCIVDHTFF